MPGADTREGGQYKPQPASASALRCRFFMDNGGFFPAPNCAGKLGHTFPFNARVTPIFAFCKSIIVVPHPVLVDLNFELQVPDAASDTYIHS